MRRLKKRDSHVSVHIAHRLADEVAGVGVVVNVDAGWVAGNSADHAANRSADETKRADQRILNPIAGVNQRWRLKSPAICSGLVANAGHWASFHQPLDMLVMLAQVLAIPGISMLHLTANQVTLALQLPFCVEVRALSDGLVSSTPE
jgi:hypothetical protein